jgi:hypothetical protein
MARWRPGGQGDRRVIGVTGDRRVIGVSGDWAVRYRAGCLGGQRMISARTPPMAATPVTSQVM